MALKSISQLELITKLNEPAEDEYKISPVMLLEDIIWGHAKGKYRAIGKLHLPIQFAYREETYDLGMQEYQIVTMFNYNFFSGCVPKYDCDIIQPFDDGWVDKFEGKWKIIGEHSNSNKASAHMFICDHVQKFLELYHMKNEFNGELGECLSQGFVKYI